MTDQEKEPTETSTEEPDILVLQYPDGTSEDVELPTGTLQTLEDRATKDGVPFDEKYILKIITEGLDLMEEKHTSKEIPEVE